jgi:hypothetical protein
VTFRLIFANPDFFPEEEGPPEGLHRLEFTEPIPFDERELRRLSPAADFERSLIGASSDGDGGLGSGDLSTPDRAGSVASRAAENPPRRCRRCQSWR